MTSILPEEALATSGHHQTLLMNFLLFPPLISVPQKSLLSPGKDGAPASPPKYPKSKGNDKTNGFLEHCEGLRVAPVKPFQTSGEKKKKREGQQSKKVKTLEF